MEAAVLSLQNCNNSGWDKRQNSFPEVKTDAHTDTNRDETTCKAIRRHCSASGSSVTWNAEQTRPTSYTRNT